MSEILWFVTCIPKVHSYWQMFAVTKHQNFICFQWELISSDTIFIVWHSMGLPCNLNKIRKVNLMLLWAFFLFFVIYNTVQNVRVIQIFLKEIFLLHKDGSKVTVKTFIMLQKISNKNGWFELLIHQRIRNNLSNISQNNSTPKLFNIDHNKCILKSNLRIRMISKVSCDTEEWSNNADKFK